MLAHGLQAVLPFFDFLAKFFAPQKDGLQIFNFLWMTAERGGLAQQIDLREKALQRHRLGHAQNVHLAVLLCHRRLVALVFRRRRIECRNLRRRRPRLFNQRRTLRLFFQTDALLRFR